MYRFKEMNDSGGLNTYSTGHFQLRQMPSFTFSTRVDAFQGMSPIHSGFLQLAAVIYDYSNVILILTLPTMSLDVVWFAWRV